MNLTKRRGWTSIMYQMSTSETGVIKSVNTTTRVIDWFQFELVDDFYRIGKLQGANMWGKAGYFFVSRKKTV